MKSRLHRIEITNFKAFRDLTSDFITYRFFFGFADLRNSEKFNIWPLFEKEILPFCVSTGGKEPLDVQSREGAEEQND